jgi:hypothetical protein
MYSSYAPTGAATTGNGSGAQHERGNRSGAQHARGSGSAAQHANANANADANGNDNGNGNGNKALPVPDLAWFTGPDVPPTG